MSEPLTEEEYHRYALEKMLSSETRFGSVYHDSGSCWDLIEFMLIEIRELREEVAALKLARLMDGDVVELVKTDNARLRDYVKHKAPCPWWDDSDTSCNCGLADALKEHGDG